jgi:hypothetical protein
MTGNVVFLGFALAGAGGISIAASLLAVLAFTSGAAVDGRRAAGRVWYTDGTFSQLPPRFRRALSWPRPSSPASPARMRRRPGCR